MVDFFVRSIAMARLSPPALPPPASVSSPIAKYVSCSRAHLSQKAMPWSLAVAGRVQGRAVSLRTWHLPSSLIVSSLKSPPSSGHVLNSFESRMAPYVARRGLYIGKLSYAPMGICPEHRHIVPRNVRDTDVGAKGWFEAQEATGSLAASSPSSRAAWRASGTRA